MTSCPLRAIALFLICLGLLLFTGIAATASALAGSVKTDACCNGGEAEDGETEPCAMADCPCFSCLTFLQQTPLKFSSPPDVALYSPRPTHPSWSGDFAAAIDYPPESV